LEILIICNIDDQHNGLIALNLIHKNLNSFYKNKVDFSILQLGPYIEDSIFFKSEHFKHILYLGNAKKYGKYLLKSKYSKYNLIIYLCKSIKAQLLFLLNRKALKIKVGERKLYFDKENSSYYSDDLEVKIASSIMQKVLVNNPFIPDPTIHLSSTETRKTTDLINWTLNSSSLHSLTEMNFLYVFFVMKNDDHQIKYLLDLLNSIKRNTKSKIILSIKGLHENKINTVLNQLKNIKSNNLILNFLHNSDYNYSYLLSTHSNLLITNDSNLLILASISNNYAFSILRSYKRKRTLRDWFSRQKRNPQKLEDLTFEGLNYMLQNT